MQRTFFRYDDWVADECLLKHNEESLKKQAELEKRYRPYHLKTSKMHFFVVGFLKISQVMSVIFRAQCDRTANAHHKEDDLNTRCIYSHRAERGD